MNGPERDAEVDVTGALEPLGRIYQWPNGYAMVLGSDHRGYAVRCCAGHETPSEAKMHGLALVVEVVTRVANQYVADWRNTPAPDGGAS